jgi:hypothetical protein
MSKGRLGAISHSRPILKTGRKQRSMGTVGSRDHAAQRGPLRFEDSVQTKLQLVSRSGLLRLWSDDCSGTLRLFQLFLAVRR